MANSIASGGRLKDRYRLERMLGRGGMAAVWLGHDEVLDRPVAIKVLSDTIASDPGFQARFRREARTLARLSHPNLARIYDFSDEGERPYLVMQLVPGENLASHLERAEHLDCDQLARELLDALSHIHEVGILHRDIKPANIIIEPSGNAKLIDFGIALPLDATALTSTGLVVGTGRYVAPEVMAGQTATERSDLYSSGLVLGSCQGLCSQQLSTLIRAMSSEDPRDRPLSAADALRRLEVVELDGQTTEDWHAPTSFDTQPLPMSPPTAEEARTSPPPEAPRPASGGRRRIAATIVGLIALAAIVAFVAIGAGGSSTDGGHQTAQQKGKGQGQEGGSGSAAATAEPPRAEEPEPSSSSSEAAAETAATPVSEAPSGSDPDGGAALNEEGFAMIQNGEYEAAVPVLEEAVSSFPEGSEELSYGYALFNLGHALRLSGRPEEAITVLERRLEIPDQEEAVREELDAAYAEAG